MKKKVALEREKQHQIALLNQENQQMEQYQSEEIRQKSNQLKSVFNQINRDNTQINRLKIEAEEMRRRSEVNKEIDSDKPLTEEKEEEEVSPNITPKGEGVEEESTLTPNMTMREERIKEMLYQREYHRKMRELGAIQEENEEEDGKETSKEESKKVVKEETKETVKEEKKEVEKPPSKSLLDLPPDLYKVFLYCFYL